MKNKNQRPNRKLKRTEREMEKTRVAEIKAIGHAIAALADVPEPQQCALLIERVLGPLNVRLSYMRINYNLANADKGFPKEAL